MLLYITAVKFTVKGDDPEVGVATIRTPGDPCCIDLAIVDCMPVHCCLTMLASAEPENPMMGMV
ncbi:MAG: hypothetical protein M1411_00400, partial [Candidatus Thermoplasmatota archaeon]|nr:hypothetical protein [Candidatus Thermoplasmatota archaeon]